MITACFVNPQAAFEACEAAGLDPLRGHDHQFVTKYGVLLPGFDRYVNIYTDEGFLRFCNNYFRVFAIRQAANWELRGRLGWFSPDGGSEAEWVEEGFPFPEDPDYAAWASTYWHYDALDNDIPPDTATLLPQYHELMGESEYSSQS